VYFDEVRFDGHGRKDHLKSKDMATSDEYTMYTSAETLPGWVVFISKIQVGQNPPGTTFCVPVARVMSCKVAERSLTQYQPLGTKESYDSPSGNRKTGRPLPKGMGPGRPKGPSKKRLEAQESQTSDS
jgi:hypothetical protein